MRMLAGLAKLLPLVAALVTPLSDAERTVIETARDDRSHEEEAFAVLLTHAASWQSREPGDEPIRLTPDFGAMIEKPERYRGALCRIEGRLEQRTGLGGAFEGDEWFVRAQDGTPVVVYLPIDESMKRLRDGQRIALNARFYKRMRFEGRDGSERTYAAFVGARPWLVDAPNPWRHLWILAALVMVLLITFLVLMAIIRRGGAARRAASRLQGSEWRDEDELPGGLPSDPAAALEELRRRTGAQP